MLKHRIKDIYKDNNKIFTSNPYILSDSKLDDFRDYLQTFDLITKYDFGMREILIQFLDEEELDYNLQEIQEAVYMNLLKNLMRYGAMITADQSITTPDFNPTYDYKITRQYGEEEKEFNYGNRSAADSYSSKQDTNQYGQKQNTNQYGQKQTTDVLGEGTETTTTAPRSVDSQDSRTTFDSTTDYDTTHNVTDTIQTVDIVVDASRTNTSTEGTHTDTLTEGTHTDTLTEGAHSVTKTEQSHKDSVTYYSHTDNVFGYKGNPTANAEKYKKYWNENTMKLIISECINTITYSLYLFS